MEISGIWKNVHDSALIGKKQDSSDTDAPSQGALTIPAPKMFCLTGPADHPKRVSSSLFPLYMVEWRRGEAEFSSPRRKRSEVRLHRSTACSQLVRDERKREKRG